jgi:DNA-binding response OmpR family regulator
MEKKDRILIIEDDEDIRMIEETYLQSAGWETEVLPDGNHILTYLREHPCDLILLDLMLPGRNGYDICQEVREKYDMPILMVTARNESVDKIRGFNSGADDYIAKPFDPLELTARVRANLRQYRRLKEVQGGSGNTGETAVRAPEIVVGDLRILPESWRVWKRGKEIRLTNREFELLKFLAQNANIVFSKEQLMEKIWGYDYIGDTSTVMVHINRIREKIEDDPKNPKILETVWGAGYRVNRS